MSIITRTTDIKLINYVLINNKIFGIFSNPEGLDSTIHTIKKLCNFSDTTPHTLISFNRIDYMILEDCPVYNEYFGYWMLVFSRKNFFEKIYTTNTISYSLIVDINNYTIYDENLNKRGTCDIGTHINVLLYTYFPQKITIYKENILSKATETIYLDDNIINGHTQFLHTIEKLQSQYCVDVVKQII